MNNSSTITAEEYQKLMAKEKPANNKFNAIKTEVSGIVFDSKKEAKRWGDLRLMENMMLITGIQRQVKFKLVGCYYLADFVYFDVEKKTWIVEDVKSEITKKLSTYRIKKKQMKALYDIEINEY